MLQLQGVEGFQQQPASRAQGLLQALVDGGALGRGKVHVGQHHGVVAAGRWRPRGQVGLLGGQGHALLLGQGAGYFEALQRAQQEAQQAREHMVQLAQRANQAADLLQENTQLRQLLALRERLSPPSQAAQVLYDAADPYTRRVVVDKGQVAGVELGSPVLDELGVLGQVTRVLPFVSEVTLLVDRDQAIPVLNPRTGARSVAYGDPVAGHGGSMELRFMPSNADVQEGDLLTTSGVDGVYPPGLPVARVRRVDRRADSAFTRIYCDPVAQVHGARHVLLLQPLAGQLPERPEPAPAPTPTRKGARK